MSFHFDTLKLTQCTAYLLRKSPGHRNNYTCLIKMLYFADRASMEQADSPITGDKPYAMENGPVLSNMLDLIGSKGSEEDQAIWDRYFEKTGFELNLLLDPGDGRLSDFETAVLDAVFEKYGERDFGFMIYETHKLPEWNETYQQCPDGSSRPIPLHTILKALGKESSYNEISQQKVEDAHFAALFGS